MIGPADTAVFIDLEGVILDVSKRYFKLHEDIVAAIGGNSVDWETYWELKRDAAPIEELAGLSKDGAKEYRKRWSMLIEAPGYLEMDEYLPQASLALKLLTSAYTVVVVALRRKGEALRHQLKALSFPDVAQVLVGASRGDATEAKAGIIRSSPHFSRHAVIVGDTEIDIRAGRTLGLTTIGVTSGWRSPDLLAQEAPDLIVAGIGELPPALKRLFAGGRP